MSTGRLALHVTSCILIILSRGQVWSLSSSHISHMTPRKCNTTISSHFEKEGEITSLGYPNYYEEGITCAYTLVGKPGERVQLIFTHFNLPDPSKDIPEHQRCLHTDFVAVYNMNNNTIRREIDHYCGSSVPLPVMSSKSGMQVVFKSGANPSTRLPHPFVYGFSVRFRFVKDFGITSGHQPTPGTCEFIYNSTAVTNGTINSPNPGGFYPQDTTCHYIFRARPGEIVRLIFKYFDVEGILPCDRTSDSDYLEFSNFPSADRKIPPYCGSVAPTVMQSDASYFRVTFKSNDKFDGTGFTADFQFMDISRQPYVIRRVVAPIGTGSTG
ncbi:suppressor of lurcher protein 1-like [Macrobrachium rosenbergii]|uniref:suppressor of lurcher protein 1-like n=1 Tax=Macrobrachium rosenbergii TaxID=79674 RepID=UPI0034D648E5